jgi:LysM repeat protein
MRFFIIILFALLSGTCYAADFQPKDSLRTEKIDGKVIVFHKVDAKETLYSLARRYKTTVSAITALNPESAKGLSLGTIIKIPTKESVGKLVEKVVDKNKVETAKTESKKEEIKKEESKKEEEPKKKDTYTVVSGDNWYAIARKTGFTVSALKQLNPEAAKGLAAGQILALKEEAKSEETAIAKEVTISKSDKPDLSPTGFEKVIEKGLCELIEDKDSRLHVALSKTAPEGTLIQIKNELNGRSIYVKVIGKLPDTGANDKVIVKISYKAFEAIDANAKKFPVVVSYSK